MAEEAAQEAADRARALSDPTRLTLAGALREGGELFACDLSWITGRSQDLVSHHMRTLRSLGMVRSRRAGKMVMYSLTVEGMDCASYVATVEKRVSALPGVSKATVNFAAGRLDVEHDPVLPLEDLEGAVRSAGYGVVKSEVVERAPFWRTPRALMTAASAGEHGAAEKRALYLVSAIFFLLYAYIAYEAVGALLSGEAPDGSAVGLVLAAISLLVMPALVYGKQRTSHEMGSETLQADASETWVCSYLSLALLAGVGLYALFGWWWADPAAALAMLCR